MATFKNYIIKHQNDEGIYDGHYHIEKEGGRTGPAEVLKTADGRKTHTHAQSDGQSTAEARPLNRFLYNDDIEANLKSLPLDGPHDHMQTDGQFTSTSVIPEPEEGDMGS